MANVLEGSVRKSGDSVADHGAAHPRRRRYHLWSQTYDRKLDDIFEIQDEIAAEVVKQLKVTLLGAAPKVRTTDPEAYALYLQADQLGRQNTAEAFAQSDALYRQVLAIDPRYAPAWTGLASELHQRGGAWAAVEQGGVRPSPRGGEKALAIDPEYAPAHAAARLDRDVRRQRSRRRRATFRARAGARSGRI